MHITELAPVNTANSKQIAKVIKTTIFVSLRAIEPRKGATRYFALVALNLLQFFHHHVPRGASDRAIGDIAESGALNKKRAVIHSYGYAAML